MNHSHPIIRNELHQIFENREEENNPIIDISPPKADKVPFKKTVLNQNKLREIEGKVKHSRSPIKRVISAVLTLSAATSTIAGFGVMLGLGGIVGGVGFTLIGSVVGATTYSTAVGAAIGAAISTAGGLLTTQSVLLTLGASGVFLVSASVGIGAKLLDVLID